MDSVTNQSTRSKILFLVNEFAVFIGHVLCILYCRLYKLINTSFVIESLRSLYYGFIGLFITDKKNLEWKTHWQSPVCRAILRRKYFMTRSKSSLSWSCFNFLLACLLIVELKNELFLSQFDSYMSMVWYTELTVAVILSLNATVAFILYIWSVFSKPMPISPVQKKLFRISDNDLGFEVKKSNDYISNTNKQEPLRFTSWRESIDCSSPSVLSITPLNYSANSWMSSPETTNVDTTSSSFSFFRPSSPTSYTSTPKNADKSYLRTMNYGEYIESPYERPIKNKKQLEEFLKAHEEEDKKVKSFEESKAFLHNVTSVDNSPMAVLGKCRYQRAYRIPHMETMEDDSTEILCGDNVLHKLKINDKMLTNWCEHVRKWIGQTILVKLVQEIDDINSTLSHIGLPEFQIGTVSLFALHQIAVTKSQYLPTLSAILPYLDLHLNQEYLCRRLKDLAHGGCMGEFKWNAGGSYDDKQWCDDLPNDSAIVMHILCCYLDAHLPQEPHFPEGKPFSSKYFKKVPEKPVVSKDLHYIYQSSLNPPHFNVFLGEDTCTLKKGRSNLFCALVIFFHYLKTKECGMLGRVNLGPSGLNILWVLD